MKGFISEISEITGLPFEEIKKDFRIVQVGSKSIHIMNYSKILSYSNEQLILKIPNNKLEISGYNFEIKELNRREILLKGIVNSVMLSRPIVPAKIKEK